ncbi:ADP-ribose pyrophosphatase [Advenella kashmirensis W13003]|uniref:GDP-mannose pyrophosphatase n=1 Tax=Advenella kashmirensis W13003 TaxID=1424334 RepID=V8QMH2_9BURK|nr:NUDIX hydrolase [Advenella kashmirensis]ETF01156.1 ADP-ribose pyrophosphatase [Advenella kashmirensis W13003]
MSTTSSDPSVADNLSDEDLTETLQDSTFIFEGKIIKVTVDTVILPNGKTATREVVRHCGAVAVLAITPEDKVILVKQFRHPTGGPLLEIPAGKLDVENEPPEQCAYRELAEETPYTAGGMTLIHSFYTAPGFCDELMHVFRAEGVRKDSSLHADDDEFVQTVLMSRDEVRQAIASQQICDAKTLVALQSWLLEQ